MLHHTTICNYSIMNNYVKVATFSEQELPYTYMDACTLFTGNVYMSQK